MCAMLLPLRMDVYHHITAPIFPLRRLARPVEVHNFTLPLKGYDVCGSISEKPLSNLPLETSMVFLFSLSSSGGYAVAQLVKVLRYKSEGRGFDSRWCHKLP
jgi:hypothetical protein